MPKSLPIHGYAYSIDERMMMRIIFVFALILILLVTIFAVQNNELIKINLLFWEIDGSLALVLVITFILGILIGLLVSTPTTLRKRSQLAEARKRLRTAETDLEEARKAMAAPSADETAQELIPEDASAGSHPPSQGQMDSGSTDS
jgi:putative membrane protein